MAEPPQQPAAQPDSRAPLPKTCANERNQHQLNLTANNIGGTADHLKRHLAKVDAGERAPRVQRTALQPRAGVNAGGSASEAATAAPELLRADALEWSTAAFSGRQPPNQKLPPLRRSTLLE
jgi:hypothetical protein